MTLNSLISIAPMMQWTDRHFRYLMRLIAPHALLYTEMVTANAILHGDPSYLLNFNELEHPVVLQLGGSDSSLLAQAAAIGQQFNYDAINLNVGCPSDRVQNAEMGACLMAKPQLVAECVAAMQEKVAMPVTVKTRIGIDHQDSYSFLVDFIGTVAERGCKTFIIHARKAWLKGLSPKQNRTIPEINYERVYRLKRDFPQLTIIINGEIATREAVLHHLTQVDGVMIGREAYHNPYFIAELEQHLWPEQALRSRNQVVQEMMPYIEEQLKQGIKLKHMTRHLLGLFHNQPGARLWRRYLTEHSLNNQAGVEVIEEALNLVNHYSNQAA